MIRIARYFVVLVLSMLSATSSLGQDPAFDMTEPEASGAAGQVLGGVPADINKWPATLVFTARTGLCTSTVIGIRTIITAAHCIDAGARGRVRIGARTYGVTCDHHPGYADDYQLDVALCLADNDIALTRGSRLYETINQSPALPRLNNAISLLGYGCTERKGDNPRQILYAGTAPVTRIAGAYVTTVGSHAVCFGDSGGGAYLEGARRLMVGINSRGDIISRSLLTNLAAPSVASFLSAWAIDNKAAVCGVTEGADNCQR